MRLVAWLVVVLLLSLCVVPMALGQKRTLPDVDGKVKNLESDIEVLQEFLQEQSNGIKALKTELANLSKVKEELARTEGKIKELADLGGKQGAAITELGQQIAADRLRIQAIEEGLKRKRIDFSGQLRIRPEFTMNQRYFNNLLDGDRNLGASHRARIGMDVAPVERLKGRFTIQDARFWGSPTWFVQQEGLGQLEDPAGRPVAPSSRDQDSALRLHEAWLEAALVRDLLSLKAGRQEWQFGAGRMIGRSDWSQSGRSFDALDLKLAWGKYIRADLLFSWITERNSLTGEDQLFGGLYATVPYLEGFDFDLYVLYLKDVREKALRKIVTLGARAGGKLPVHPAFFFDLEGALQVGQATEQLPTDQATRQNSVYAIYFHADAGYAIPVTTTPTLSLFFDMASGDGNTSPVDPSNDLAVAWTPLFPTRHNLFGQMDIFGQSNIWDVGFRAQFEPVTGLEVRAEFHSLHLYADTGKLPWGANTADSYLDPIDTGLGSEIDLTARYRLNDNFALSGGYGLFLPGQAMSDLDERDPVIINDQETNDPYRYPRGDAAHWLFVEADLTF